MNKRSLGVFAAACFSIVVVIHLAQRSSFGRVSSTEEALKSNDYDNETNWQKDWDDYEEIGAALKRKGLGEVGEPASFEDYRKEIYDKYGFEVLLSDSISLQRSVPDVRPAACRNITYLATLPRSSIVIIFHNERLSVLLRTVHSILNRTPAELLQEILLVDDGSTWPDMQADLEQYFHLHFPPETSKVKLMRQSTRGGIMTARMAGARAASKASKVLIFLDSHFEVGYNWLPPLLEPIAIDPKTCTCPIIDRIAYDSFSYTANSPWRGYFDYHMNYQMRPLRNRELEQPEKNFRNYIMMGGAMAIGSDFFWDIGGFDEGMTQWGGEQFEMSLKIWMCGGQLLDVPCSRMGHLFRDATTKGNTILYDDYAFVQRNYRRVLDVWVEDENRNYFYQNRPQLKDVEPGDLTAQIEIRERLQCKNFSWMLENVMPDTHDVFLPIEPFDLASGLIRSVYDPTLCMVLGNDTSATLEPCPTQNGAIDEFKQWQYTWRGEFRISGSTCLESNLESMKVASYICHFSWGNQKWYYDRDKQWIMKLDEKLCVLANANERSINLAACDVENSKLKWTFSHMNFTEMDRWDTKLKMNLDTGLF